MGQAAIHRALRRETKRTLRHHLEQFAAQQAKRLDAVEHALALNDRGDLGSLQDEHHSRSFNDSMLGDRLHRLETLTCWQRLRWLVIGRLPAVPWSWKGSPS